MQTDDTALRILQVKQRRRELLRELERLERRECEILGLAGQRGEKRANKELERYGFDGCARSTP